MLLFLPASKILFFCVFLITMSKYGNRIQLLCYAALIAMSNQQNFIFLHIFVLKTWQNPQNFNQAKLWTFCNTPKNVFQLLTILWRKFRCKIVQKFDHIFYDIWSLWHSIFAFFMSNTNTTSFKLQKFSVHIVWKHHECRNEGFNYIYHICFTAEHFSLNFLIKTTQT